MRYQLVTIVLLLSAPLLAEGTEPKPAATDYPAHAALPNLSLGAEYLVHSFAGRNQTFVTSDYLVVEVAVYPSSGQKLGVSIGQFTLRLIGKKTQVLAAEGPGFVAASLKYPNWVQRPTLQAGAGAGDAGVIIGGRQATERFPGDPTGRRLPAPPRAPEPENRAGVEKEAPARPDEVLAQTALPERQISSAVSGYLFFPFKGKTKSVRSAELIYSGPAGTATLRLF